MRESRRVASSQCVVYGEQQVWEEERREIETAELWSTVFETCVSAVSISR